MHTVENKLGIFYLGKIIDPKTGKMTQHPLLYDSKDLTTHAMCVGMTGSGKTGLGIALLEEAAIDGIPAIILDPKGDLGNLLLAFPGLEASNFLPWIEQDEVARSGLTADKYAENVAKTWKDGLEEWGEDSKRIESYKKAVDTVIYTPASQAGIPLSLLNSFTAPSEELMLDSAAFRDRILTTTSSLLGLLGIEADPIKSKEHILISTILEQAWREKRNLDLASLIQQIQKPPFSKVGVFDLETFYPAKERLNLSIQLNNLLASPGFHAWMQGEPLEIQRLLYTKDGKPRHAIISIAHLSDAERMFFVTLLLNEVLAWVRRQSGTSSLRAILYMDEIFGFFPPTSNPPSKTPMLALLKQARAFGMGVVLATQNPVDLDYKGLSNCGTWFIGKLQTERDRSRIIEGLKVASMKDANLEDIQSLLARCGKRIFVMNNVHQPAPVLFQTRWTLSYLRGPLTLPQIKQLTKKDISEQVDQPLISSVASNQEKPPIPAGIEEFLAKLDGGASSGQIYRPLILVIAKAHFVDSKSSIDTWQDYAIAAPLADNGKDALWDDAIALPRGKDSLSKELPESGQFEDVPAGLLQAKSYSAFAKSYMNYLYQTQTLDLFQEPDLKMISKPQESEGDFRARISVLWREKRDENVAQIRKKYEVKIQALQEKIRKAEEKLAKQKQQAGMQKFDTFLSVGKTILGAILGKKVWSSTRVSEAGTSMRKASKIGKEDQEVANAEADVENYKQQLDDMQSDLEKEISDIQLNNPDQIPLNKISIRPRKTDILVETTGLVWWPLVTTKLIK